VTTGEFPELGRLRAGEVFGGKQHVQDGLLALVMQPHESEGLDVWIAKFSPLPVQLAVEVILQTCAAVAPFHKHGKVLRSLQTANLLCVRRPDGQLRVELSDSTIIEVEASSDEQTKHSQVAVAEVESEAALVTQKRVRGSPKYMSPEQTRDADAVDTRANIWSLGIILFELLTTKLPFEADEPFELTVKVDSFPTPSVRAVRPDVSEGLQAVLDKCLDKRAEQRFGTVAQLAMALRPFAPSHTAPLVRRIVATLAGTRRATPEPETATPEPETAKPGPESVAVLVDASTPLPFELTVKSKKTSFHALAVGAALAVVVLLVFVITSAREEAPRTTVTKPASSSASSNTLVPREQKEISPESSSTERATRDTLPRGALPPMSNKIERRRSDGAARKRFPVTAPTPSPSPRSKVSADPKAAPKDCDPPFYFDANGNRLFKKECV